MRGEAAALLAGVLVASCGGSSPAHTTDTVARRAPTTVPRSVARAIPGASKSYTVTLRPRRPHSACPRGAGARPQTAALPSASTKCFHELMRSLWRGISTGSARPAMPAFFPEAAYAQIKAFADDRADWNIRLLLDYKLDLRSAHDVVGGRAQFVGVRVPSAYAHWVPPGACVNTGGYYEVPNSRLLYRRDGQLRSIGIASMISWRGIWYVVHLGATFRVGNVGVVHDPSVGPGVAAPSSTC